MQANEKQLAAAGKSPDDALTLVSLGIVAFAPPAGRGNASVLWLGGEGGADAATANYADSVCRRTRGRELYRSFESFGMDHYLYLCAAGSRSCVRAHPVGSFFRS